jgi:hypothetical protein
MSQIFLNNCFKLKRVKLNVAVNVCNPSIWEVRQELFKFEAGMGCTVSACLKKQANT